VAIVLQLSFFTHYECTSASSINSATMKPISRDNLHTEAMTYPPQINTYTVVGKEIGHKRGTLIHVMVCVVAMVDRKAHVRMKRSQAWKKSST